MGVKRLNAYIHHHPVLAWAQTGEQSNGKSIGIVMLQCRIGPRPEWVTGFYRQGEQEWPNGNYFGSLKEAWANFIDRATMHMEGLSDAQTNDS